MIPVWIQNPWMEFSLERIHVSCVSSSSSYCVIHCPISSLASADYCDLDFYNVAALFCWPHICAGPIFNISSWCCEMPELNYEWDTSGRRSSVLQCSAKNHKERKKDHKIIAQWSNIYYILNSFSTRRLKSLCKFTRWSVWFYSFYLWVSSLASLAKAVEQQEVWLLCLLILQYSKLSLINGQKRVIQRFILDCGRLLDVYDLGNRPKFIAIVSERIW